MLQAAHLEPTGAPAFALYAAILEGVACGGTLRLLTVRSLAVGRIAEAPAALALAP